MWGKAFCSELRFLDIYRFLVVSLCDMKIKRGSRGWTKKMNVNHYKKSFKHELIKKIVK